MIAFEIFIAAAKRAKGIKKFVEDGPLTEALSAFGDVEHKAAIEALNGVAHAQNPHHQVLLAVGHLQSAHTAYEASYQTTQGTKAYFNTVNRMAALQKAIFNLCLMAICYRYLGETQLTHDTLERAKKTQTQNIWTMRFRDMGGAKGVIKSLAQVGGSWLNPSSYSILLKFDRGLIPEIETDALEQFCTVLQSSE